MFLRLTIHFVRSEHHPITILAMKPFEWNIFKIDLSPWPFIVGIIYTDWATVCTGGKTRTGVIGETNDDTAFHVCLIGLWTMRLYAYIVVSKGAVADLYVTTTMNKQSRILILVGPEALKFRQRFRLPSRRVCTNTMNMIAMCNVIPKCIKLCSHWYDIRIHGQWRSSNFIICFKPVTRSLTARGHIANKIIVCIRDPKSRRKIIRGTNASSQSSCFST